MGTESKLFWYFYLSRSLSSGGFPLHPPGPSLRHRENLQLQGLLVQSQTLQWMLQDVAAAQRAADTHPPAFTALTDAPASFPPGGTGTNRDQESLPFRNYVTKIAHTHPHTEWEPHEQPSSPSPVRLLPSSIGPGRFPPRMKGQGFLRSPAPSYRSRPLHSVRALARTISQSIYPREASVPSFFHISSLTVRHLGRSPSASALRPSDRGEQMSDPFRIIIRGAPEYTPVQKSFTGGREGTQSFLLPANVK